MDDIQQGRLMMPVFRNLLTKGDAYFFVLPLKWQRRSESRFFQQLLSWLVKQAVLPNSAEDTLTTPDEF